MAYDGDDAVSKGRMKERARGGQARALVQTIIANGPQPHCVFWPYATNSAGYGHIGIKGTNILVSRLVCEGFNGSPPTPRHQAAHACGNGHLGCCNPGCLYWATPRENALDRLKHGTDGNGPNNPAAKLTTEAVIAIRSNPTGLMGKDLAVQFGVSKQQISKIRLGLRRAVS